MKNQTTEIGRLFCRLFAQITVFAEIKHEHIQYERDAPHTQKPTSAHANKQKH